MEITEQDTLNFTTMTNVIQNLLVDIRDVYITGDSKDDRNMRARIRKVLDLINSENHMSNIIVKGDKFTAIEEEVDDDGSSSHSQDSSSEAGKPTAEEDEAYQDQLGKLVSEIGQDYQRTSMRKRHNSVFVPPTVPSAKGPNGGQQWLANYSPMAMLEVNEQLIGKAHAAVTNNELSSDGRSSSQISSIKMRKTISLNSMVAKQLQNETAFAALDSFDFNCFEFSRKVGRQNALPYAVFKMIQNCDEMVPNNSKGTIDTDCLLSFLTKLQQGYRTEVQYHNDLHAADVAQALYNFMRTGNVHKWAELSYLDCVAAVIAAACHDFDHDGLNNAYHVNFSTERAVRYHDKAVQENWHASEGMSLLLLPHNDFIKDFSKDECRIFRKRVVEMILATDMAEHASHLNVIKYKTENLGIKKELDNGHLMIDHSDDKSLYQSRQMVLELLIHAADLSTPMRPFECLKEWTYLLFEEFFLQGDLERENEMPISFLCDRESVNVVQSQPGFLKFIVLPLYTQVATIVPQLEECRVRCLESVAKWEAYEETEDDKAVYEKPTKQAINLLNVPDLMGSQVSEPGSAQAVVNS